MDAETDETLVARCQAEFPYQTRAFARLVHRYHSRVMGKVLQMLPNREEAEDVCQDIFVRVFQGLPSFQGDASFSTWLYAITTNTCLNHIDKMKRRPWRWFGENFEEAQRDGHLDIRLFYTIGRGLERADMRKRIDQTFALLNKSDREVLKLRFVEELDYQTIADRLGLGLSAVKMRIKRAREHFRTQFDTIGG